jgi:hypothetical protein
MQLTLIVHQAQPKEILDAALALGFRRFGLSLQWHLVETTQGVHDWWWADQAVDTILAAGGSVGAGLVSFPAWLDKTAAPSSASGAPSITIMKPEWVPLWQDYVDRVTTHFDGKITNWGLDLETTISGWWASKDPSQYVQQILLPASEIIHSKQGRVTAPGTTLRGESRKTYEEAKRHWKQIYKEAYSSDATMSAIDRLSFHCYRNDGVDVVSDVRRFLLDIPEHTHFHSEARRLAITETGFTPGNGRGPSWIERLFGKTPLTPEEDQAHQWKQVVRHDGKGVDYGDWISDLSIYHSHGSASGIFNEDFSPKQSVRYLAEFL